MGESHVIFMLVWKMLSRYHLLPHINLVVAEQYQELESQVAKLHMNVNSDMTVWG